MLEKICEVSSLLSYILLWKAYLLMNKTHSSENTVPSAYWEREGRCGSCLLENEISSSKARETSVS